MDKPISLLSKPGEISNFIYLRHKQRSSKQSDPLGQRIQRDYARIRGERQDALKKLEETLDGLVAFSNHANANSDADFKQITQGVVAARIILGRMLAAKDIERQVYVLMGICTGRTHRGLSDEDRTSKCAKKYSKFLDYFDRNDDHLRFWLLSQNESPSDYIATTAQTDLNQLYNKIEKYEEFRSDYLVKRYYEGAQRCLRKMLYDIKILTPTRQPKPPAYHKFLLCVYKIADDVSDLAAASPEYEKLTEHADFIASVSSVYVEVTVQFRHHPRITIGGFYKNLALPSDSHAQVAFCYAVSYGMLVAADLKHNFPTPPVQLENTEVTLSPADNGTGDLVGYYAETYGFEGDVRNLRAPIDRVLQKCDGICI